MSRSKRGSKAPGYEFWSRRPCSGSGYGKYYKKFCHRIERQDNKRIVIDELNDLKIE